VKTKGYRVHRFTCVSMSTLNAEESRVSLMNPVLERAAKACTIVLCAAVLLVCGMQIPVGAEDAWEQEAQQRIDRIRKADLTVRVVDADGKPMSGVPVHVAMVRHAFPWGTCVSEKHITGPEPDDIVYRETLVKLFNCAVPENELKWNAWHGAYGPEFTREKTELALKWLKEKAFRIRGHCLVWPDWEYLGPWGESLRDDLPALRQRILDHIDEMAAFTAPYVNEWDVVNEPVHKSTVTEALGGDCMSEWFSRARAALPGSCRLFINEYNIVEQPFSAERDEYEKIISSLLAQGAPLEGIGFQSHFQPPLITSPREILAIFDRFAHFGVPIMVTEFDVNSKKEDWQAHFTRDFLTAAFSHPACSGFVFWGFWEGAHWRPDAALFRKDWSEKPNLNVYRDLVYKTWWTDDKGQTDDQGEFPLRVFKGTHRIVVDKQERELSVNDSATVEIVL